VVSFDEPRIPMAQERGILNKRVRIYWIVQGQWFEGLVTRYHRRKKRHRVEYDDGDHEWISFETDGDRVQVQLPDGVWVMVSACYWRCCVVC
jgi:hypothetical protein